MQRTFYLTVPFVVLLLALTACDNASGPGPNKPAGGPSAGANDKPTPGSGAATNPGNTGQATPGSAVPPEEVSPEAKAVQALPQPPRWQGPGISWVPPGEWKQEDSESKLRIATLTRDEGENNIQIAVTKLGLQFGGLLDNINRWAGQVGLAPLTDADLDKVTTEFQADGRTGLIVTLIGPQQTMLVAILRSDDASYFFKMAGADPIVGRNRDTFLKLVGSVKFGAAAGPAAQP